jgi:hypothetical protein
MRLAVRITIRLCRQSSDQSLREGIFHVQCLHKRRPVRSVMSAGYFKP